MNNPVIALLTDFGTRDHYVGAMKGVILGICPDAVLVDITHEIAPQDVRGAALELAAAYRYFPTATTFLVVVDPGVGSARRALAAEAGGYRFVAPDNGVLGTVLAAHADRRIVELANPRYARPTISRTFEGRDRFAPAAAWLARGVALAELGPVQDGFELLELPVPLVSDREIQGEVVRVDRFGNLVTNIDRSTFERLREGGLAITVGPDTIARLVATYAEAAPGEICALFGSSEHLEIAVSGGSAERALGTGRGGSVRVRAGG